MFPIFANFVRREKKRCTVYIYNVFVVFLGTKQVYCHLNYLFLGLMIEELTGMSYMDFITDMFHCLGVGSLEDVDYTEDLQKEDIYLDGLQNIVCVYNVSYCLMLTKWCSYSILIFFLLYVTENASNLFMNFHHS